MNLSVALRGFNDALLSTAMEEKIGSLVARIERELLRLLRRFDRQYLHDPNSSGMNLAT